MVLNRPATSRAKQLLDNSKRLTSEQIRIDTECLGGSSTDLRSVLQGCSGEAVILGTVGRTQVLEDEHAGKMRELTG